LALQVHKAISDLQAVKVFKVFKVWKAQSVILALQDLKEVLVTQAQQDLKGLQAQSVLQVQMD
jgi:hypothetical protein